METPSSWADTKTFFPLLLSALERKGIVGRACVVGASDGKFVLPLAEKGWQVAAIDNDPVALFGGQIEFPKGKFHETAGLQGRAHEHGLVSQIELILADMYEFDSQDQFDAVFTSCSWHYSKNHDRPVRDFVHKMQQRVVVGGIFCAEYMMPVEAKHFDFEHYMQEGQIRQYFSRNEWEIVEEFYTSPFREKAHMGNLEDHVHRMGFLMAHKKLPPA